MSKFILPTVLLLATAAGAAQVDRVIVRQQWPWHDGVKVEYVLSGVTGPVDIGVSVSRDGTPVAVPQNAISGDVFGVRDCVGTIMIDPRKAFGSGKVKIDSLKVELTVADSDENLNEALYKIFDLTSGACEDVTRKDLLNGKWGSFETDYSVFGEGFTTGLDDVLVWTGVTNNPAYKTDKLVMRKIHAKDKTWLSGDASDFVKGDAPLQPQKWVRMTYDYYIAVFETTQAQIKKIDGSLPSGCFYADKPDSDYRPANNVARYNAYAHPTAGSPYLGLVTGVNVIFPNNAYLRDVGEYSTCGRMWKKTKAGGMCYEFNLPLGCEWEFAMRGGNDTALYSGKAQTYDNVQEIAWVKPSQYPAETDELYAVGQKAPNAYGLYDMAGNVLEWINIANGSNLGQGGTSGSGDSADDPVVDPLGKADTAADSGYAFGGGGAAANEANGGGYWQDCRPAARHSYLSWYQYRKCTGLRFVMPARADGQWADHPAK